MYNWFLLYSKVNSNTHSHMCVCVCVCIYTHTLFQRIYSHTGYCKVLSRVPYALWQVLITYLFYTRLCVYINPNLPINLSPLSPLGFPGGSSGKSICLPMQEMQENVGLISGLGRSPGVGNSKLPLYSFPGTFHGQWSLVGYSPWGHKKRTPLSMHTHTHKIFPW